MWTFIWWTNELCQLTCQSLDDGLLRLSYIFSGMLNPSILFPILTLENVPEATRILRIQTNLGKSPSRRTIFLRCPLHWRGWWDLWSRRFEYRNHAHLSSLASFDFRTVSPQTMFDRHLVAQARLSLYLSNHNIIRQPRTEINQVDCLA